MRIRIAALLLALLTVLSVTACAPATGAPLGMQRASSEHDEYSLFVPDAWTVTQSGGTVSAYISSSDPTNVSVMSWSMEHSDATVADWWQQYVPEFEAVFSDFTIEAEEDTVLDGTAARKYVYTGSLGGKTYRYTQYAAVRTTALSGVSVHVLTFTESVDAENPIDHSEDFSSIITSFRWND